MTSTEGHDSTSGSPEPPNEQEGEIRQDPQVNIQDPPVYGPKSVHTTCLSCGSLVHTKVKAISSTASKDELDSGGRHNTIFCCYSGIGGGDCQRCKRKCRSNGQAGQADMGTLFFTAICCCVCSCWIWMLPLICVEACYCGSSKKEFHHSCPNCKAHMATVLPSGVRY